MSNPQRYHRDFFPFDMRECVFYFPFDRYGAQAQRIWDQSGQLNHGVISGAVPAISPMLSPLELVINGTFTGDTDWIKGTGWAITTVAAKTPGVASDLEQDIDVIPSTWYHLLYTLARTGGSITPQIGGVNGITRNATGVYEDLILATGTGNLKFQGDASFDGDIDDCSVHIIAGHESLGWYFDGVNDRIVHPSIAMGKAHTLHYWLKRMGNRDDTPVIHGGLADYHGLKITDTTVSYSAAAGSLVAVAHGGVDTTTRNTLFSVARILDQVTFFQDGAKIGDTQTLPVNDNLTLTDIGRYSDGSYYFNGVLYEAIGLERVWSPLEIKAYYDVTQWGYGGRIVNYSTDPVVVKTHEGSTFNRGDFTATNAFFWSSIDLSPYKGTDVGSTPYWIRLVDGAGKVATGYLAGVGAGETLGSELLTSHPNGIGGLYLYDTFTNVGKDITSAIALAPGVFRSGANVIAYVIGQLYKSSDELTLNSGEAPQMKFNDGDYSGPIVTLANGSNITYFTSRASGSLRIRDLRNANATNFSLVGSFKRVTDPPSTAIHIVSSLNGTTRAWENIEAGFNPNTIASWGIYRLQIR